MYGRGRVLERHLLRDSQELHEPAGGGVHFGDDAPDLQQPGELFGRELQLRVCGSELREWV